MERMRPEVDLLEQLTAYGVVDIPRAVGIFRGDAAGLRLVATALLNGGVVDLCEGQGNETPVPQWRWREILRDERLWEDPAARGGSLRLSATDRTRGDFERDSTGFFDRLFGDPGAG